MLYMELSGSLINGLITFDKILFFRFENVENGKYGRDYLISLSKQLKSVPTVIFDINTPEMRSAKKKLSEVLDPELTEFSL